MNTVTMLSKAARPLGFRKVIHRFIRISPKLLWRLPSSLSCDELNKQLMLRNIKSPGDYEQSVSLLERAVNAQGGYDNGLTTDKSLATEKITEEARCNKLSDSQYYEGRVFAKTRHQLRLKRQFKEVQAITFKTNNTINITGTYEDVCRHRREVIDALNISMCEETMYSFAGRMITDVMEHVKRVPSQFGVHCSVVRICLNGNELYIAALSGPDYKRQEACNSFEELFDNLKSQATYQNSDELILLDAKKRSLKESKAFEPKTTHLVPYD